MDVAVGVGGAVVEDETGLALVTLYHLVVETLGLHGGEHLRLPLGKPRPHGKVRLGKMNGVVVVHGDPPIY